MILVHTDNSSLRVRVRMRTKTNSWRISERGSTCKRCWRYRATRVLNDFMQHSDRTSICEETYDVLSHAHNKKPSCR